MIHTTGMAHTGVMVAFFLPAELAGRIAAPGGEPASDLHVTLAYLGENATTRLDKAKLLSVLGGFAAYQFEIEGRFNGVAQFVNGEERAFVTLLDAPALSKFRQRLVECLEQNRMGVAYDHGFIPHVTLAYNQAPEYTAVAAEFGKPILFSEITLAWGDERVTFRLQAQPIIEAKEISTTPPQAVRDAAKRGLELREKYGRGGLSTQEAGKQGIGSGVARAVSLSRGQAQSMNTIKRMSAFFSRHEKNKNTPPEKGNGQISWLLWGGDAGKEWAEGLLAKRKEVSEKHLSGQHNQKRHGWRGSSVDSARRAMRSGVSSDFEGKTTPAAERDAARKKWGLLKIDREAQAGARSERRSKLEAERDAASKKLDTSVSRADLDGFTRQKYPVSDFDGKASERDGWVKGHFGISDGSIAHIPTGRLIPVSGVSSMDEAKLAVSSMLKNGVLSDKIKDPANLSKEEINKFYEWTRQMSNDYNSPGHNFEAQAKAFRAQRQAETEAKRAGLSIHEPTPRPFSSEPRSYAPGHGRATPADTKNWNEAKFSVRQSNGEKSVRTGWAKGDFGIHKSEADDGFYIVTHLPSGAKVAGYKNISAAKRLGGVLDRSNLPYATELFGKGGNTSQYSALANAMSAVSHSINPDFVFMDMVNWHINTYKDFAPSHQSRRSSKRTAPFSQSKEINDSYKEFTASGKSAGIYVFKENGTWRWVTFSSNPYRDRDREIVSLKALEADVSRADADGKFGPLRWWHVPRLDLGDCDFNMMHGRILVESGTFRTPEIAEAIKEVANDLEVSIGFVHPPSEPDGDGVFHTIRRFERSLCPKGRVSNLFTRFMVG